VGTIPVLHAELREKGEMIPADVVNDLRSAKTVIQILKADLRILRTFQESRLIREMLNST